MRLKNYYWVLKTTFNTALGLTDVQGYEWDGINFVIRHSDTTTPNNPISGITKVTENYDIIPWSQIRAQFFNAVPTSMFNKLTVTFDTTKIYLNLNLEE